MSEINNHGFLASCEQKRKEDEWKRNNNAMYSEPTTPKRTIAQLAQEAIDIQNACNIRGVSKSFAKIVDEVYDLIQADAESCPISFTRYENIRTHPIVRLWASKIHDMACMGVSDGDAYAHAYDACEKLAKGGQ